MSQPEVPTVIFIGQPNGGKSTLFNSIAGLKAETSNFPGTTVKHTHSRVAIEGRLLDIVDECEPHPSDGSWPSPRPSAWGPATTWYRSNGSSGSAC